jgi:hypothetical protein
MIECLSAGIGSGKRNPRGVMTMTIKIKGYNFVPVTTGRKVVRSQPASRGGCKAMTDQHLPTIAALGLLSN